jgi:hypothetical protein
MWPELFIMPQISHSVESHEPAPGTVYEAHLVEYPTELGRGNNVRVPTQAVPGPFAPVIYGPGYGGQQGHGPTDPLPSKNTNAAVMGWLPAAEKYDKYSNIYADKLVKFADATESRTHAARSEVAETKQHIEQMERDLDTMNHAAWPMHPAAEHRYVKLKADLKLANKSLSNVGARAKDALNEELAARKAHYEYVGKTMWPKLIGRSPDERISDIQQAKRDVLRLTEIAKQANLDVNEADANMKTAEQAADYAEAIMYRADGPSVHLASKFRQAKEFVVIQGKNLQNAKKRAKEAAADAHSAECKAAAYEYYATEKEPGAGEIDELDGFM